MVIDEDTKNLVRRDTDLHLYLSDGPDIFSFSDLLSLYGFSFIKTDDRFKDEPSVDYFKWRILPISDAGFDLLFFHDLFKDDLNYGKFDSFIIINGSQQSSNEDLAMIDTIALLLLNRYGGRLHNPHRIDKITTSFLLSGKPFSGLTTN